MRLRLLPSHSFHHSRSTLVNRITSLFPTIRQEEQKEHNSVTSQQRYIKEGDKTRGYQRRGPDQVEVQPRLAQKT